MLLALGLVLVMIAVFEIPTSTALADPTNNFGSFVSQIAQTEPGAVAEAVHLGQQEAAEASMNFGAAI